MKSAFALLVFFFSLFAFGLLMHLDGIHWGWYVGLLIATVISGQFLFTLLFDDGNIVGHIDRF